MAQTTQRRAGPSNKRKAQETDSEPPTPSPPKKKKTATSTSGRVTARKSTGGVPPRGVPPPIQPQRTFLPPRLRIPRYEKLRYICAACAFSEEETSVQTWHSCDSRDTEVPEEHGLAVTKVALFAFGA